MTDDDSTAESYVYAHFAQKSVITRHIIYQLYKLYTQYTVVRKPKNGDMLNTHHSE